MSVRIRPSAFFFGRAESCISLECISKKSRSTPFEPSSKRKRGFPSETAVKRGQRVVHGDKELLEKLGRNDLCPCGSGRRFKRCCLTGGRFRWFPAGLLLLDEQACSVDLLGK
ncbi:MAG: SEC-C metal-binding domain-containing protein [Candidatus Obscuribacterales bacterium]